MRVSFLSISKPWNEHVSFGRRLLQLRQLPPYFSSELGNPTLNLRQNQEMMAPNLLPLPRIPLVQLL